MGLDFKDLLLIFLIVLLFFGGKKIPEVARGLGKGLREFKKAKDGLDENGEPEKSSRPGAPGPAVADTASTSPNQPKAAPAPGAGQPPAAKGQA